MTHFLKCDMAACDYVETVPDGINEMHIGRLCAHCGETLLTERDYRQFVAVLHVLPGPPDCEPSAPGPDETIVSSTVHVHDGEITIRIREELPSSTEGRER